MNLLEEKLGEIFEDIGIGNYFLNMFFVILEIILIMEKWDFIKLENVYVINS